MVFIKINTTGISRRLNAVGMYTEIRKGNLSENIILEYNWRCMEPSLDCAQQSGFIFSSAKPLDSTIKNFVSVVSNADEHGVNETF
jgi:hypothetical protein